MTSDRTALVTGAGGGIDAAIIERLARDGRAGALGDADRLRDNITSVLDSGATMSILVNCAGVMRRGDALSLHPEDWATSFRVNSEAVFELCRLLLPHMGRSAEARS